MSNPTSNFNWQMPTATDLVTDLPADFEVFGQAVDTSLADLKGGTAGQVLAKNTNADMDFVWVAQDDSNAIQNAIVDAKGDLIAATAADTPARLAVGTNGHVLTADSAEATGLKWAAPAAGGKVLQVINATTTTSATNTTTTYADTNLTASITPSATNSKVLVTVSQIIGHGIVESVKLKLLRGGTDISVVGGFLGYVTVGGVYGEVFGQNVSISYLDSPNTTSATTYKTQFALNTGSGNAFAQGQGERSYITLMEIGA